MNCVVKKVCIKGLGMIGIGKKDLRVSLQFEWNRANVCSRVCLIQIFSLL